MYITFLTGSAGLDWRGPAAPQEPRRRRLHDPREQPERLVYHSSVTNDTKHTDTNITTKRHTNTTTTTTDNDNNNDTSNSSNNTITTTKLPLKERLHAGRGRIHADPRRGRRRKSVYSKPPS